MKRFSLCLLLINSFLYYSCLNKSQHPPNEEKEITHLDTIKTNEGFEIVFTELQKLTSKDKQKELLLELSLKTIDLDNKKLFLKINSLARKRAIQLNDSIALAETYWDKGSFYKNKEITDTAFYYYNKSQNIYATLGDKYYQSRLYKAMAYTQQKGNDYTGAEITLTKALKSLDDAEEDSKKTYKHYFNIYNAFGVIYNALHEYDKAIDAHKKAQEYLNKLPDSSLFPTSYNNLGVVYHNKGDYKNSLEYYKKGLNTDSLYYHNPKLYSMFLDNLAYSEFKMGKNENLPRLFYKSLAIRDSLSFIDGVLINKLHLAEYYLSKKDTIKAYQFAYDVKETAPEYQYSIDVLDALLLLKKIDPKKANRYSDRYIFLNDSLQLAERRTRNKFAKIQFETDAYIRKNKVLNQQLIYNFLLSGFIILAVIFIYIYQRQRNKNKALILEQEKEKAIREIDQLLVDQEWKMLKIREEEKDRIAKELHDNALSQLFGIRINLELLNDINTEEAKNKRWSFISKLGQSEKEIRKISHELNQSQMEKANLTSLIRELINRQKELEVKFNLTIDNKINWNKIDKPTQVNIYRILQEAIQNIHKHAKASKSWIKFVVNDKKLCISIIDNGKGFTKRKVQKGIGITNMYDRAKNMNTNIYIEADEPSGTIITLELVYE